MPNRTPENKNGFSSDYSFGWQTNSRTEILARVASLYFEEGLTQEQISMHLGYSRSYISRMITEAKQEGIVEIYVHHPLERVFALEQSLEKVFKLNEVCVLKRKDLAYPQMLTRLGGLGARLLSQKITEQSIIGISWGNALFEVGNALTFQDFPEVKIVQLIGSATSQEHQVDGPGLARLFAYKLNGQYYTLAAPWLVVSKEIRDALLREKRMHDVLELMKKVDLAFVGIGSIDLSICSLIRAGFLTTDEASGLAEMGVVGDVCGHHFDIHGNLMEVPLAGYAFGIDTTTLHAIPLAIGVAGGSVKAPAILGALRSRLVNSLVTDETAAQVILELNRKS
jgi:deoxyribonucleoside regulator